MPWPLAYILADPRACRVIRGEWRRLDRERRRAIAVRPPAPAPIKRDTKIGPRHAFDALEPYAPVSLSRNPYSFFSGDAIAPVPSTRFGKDKEDVSVIVVSTRDDAGKGDYLDPGEASKGQFGNNRTASSTTSASKWRGSDPDWCCRSQPGREEKSVWLATEGSTIRPGKGRFRDFSRLPFASSCDVTADTDPAEEAPVQSGRFVERPEWALELATLQSQDGKGEALVNQADCPHICVLDVKRCR